MAKYSNSSRLIGLVFFVFKSLFQYLSTGYPPPILYNTIYKLISVNTTTGSGQNVFYTTTGSVVVFFDLAYDN
jgi:hypothetical protein